MKIGLIGSSGYIAEFLIKRFAKEKHIDSVVKIDQNDLADLYLDLSNAEKFDYSILEYIDLIVFTAAISGPDKCAADYDYCWNINVKGTIYFIRQAILHNCKVLFFSSDAVYGDISGHIYTEQSETKAEIPYGRMKKAVEDEFKKNLNFKTIRLSYVVSAKDRFITYCLNCMKENEIANIYHPFYRNCITVSDVVDIVVWFSQNWEEYPYFALNAAGSELVSRVRIADEINRYFGYKLIYRVTMPSRDFFSNRTRVTQMKSLYLQCYNILEEKSFTEKVQKELKEMDL